MAEKQQAEPPKYDPAQQVKLYADIAQKSGRLVTQFLERQKNGGSPGVSDELGITQAFFQAWTKVLSDPFKLAEAQMKFWQDTASLWQSLMLKLMGRGAKTARRATAGLSPLQHEDWQ